VTSQMDLSDSLGRNSREIFQGREAVIDGADIDIVDVQQNAAVGFVSDRRKKDPFRQARN